MNNTPTHYLDSFVLYPHHDPFAEIALRVYILIARTAKPELCVQLEHLLHRVESQQQFRNKALVKEALALFGERDIYDS